MKKLFFALALIAFFGFLAFGDNGKQEEVDFLLFMPDSGNQFANEEQAMIQLDNTAKYLMDRNPAPGQIFVYGYAAAFANEIDAADLSRNRALLVINELQKRGLPKELFADPIAYGSVDLWGSNTGDEGRSPNRRVRILLDNTILTPAVIQAADSVIETPGIDREESIQTEKAPAESHSSFPWWIILLALIVLAVLLFLASKRRKSPKDQATQKENEIKPIAIVPVLPSEKVKVLEEEEIRRYAYGLYEKRYGQNGDETGDWYRAICELTSYYEAQGYRVILYWEA